MRAALLALVTVALLTLAPAAAHADDPLPRVAIRLNYVLGPGAQNCPPEQTLHDEVARRMGYDPFTPNAPDLVVATLNRSGNVFRGTLELFDSSGKSQWKKSYAFRGKKDEDCAALDTSMGIDISVAYMDIDFSLQPPAAAPNPPPAPEPPPPAEAPPPSSAPPPKDELPPSLPLPRSEPLRLNLGIASALALRTVSRPFAFNLIAAAGLRYRSFSGAFEFRWTPPEVVASDLTGRELVRVTQYAGGVLPCGHFLALVYCGVGQVTAVVGKSAPGVEPQSVTKTTVATGTRVGVDLPLPMWGRRFAVRLSADLLATLHDVAFHVDDTTAHAMNSSPTWTTPRLTVAFGAGFVTDLRLKSSPF